MRYFGPFQIVQKIGNVAYQLCLLEGTRILPVFHVSLLKKCEGDPGRIANQIPLPLVTSKLGLTLQPDSILQHRTILRHDVPVR